MGSYSVCCVMSKLSIPHGRVKLIPIKKQKHPYYGCSSEYYPYCLPLTGEYDTYGGIENIERDINVEIIERYFGIPIEDFAAAVTNNVSDPYRHVCYKGLLTEDIQALSMPDFFRKIGYQEAGFGNTGPIYRAPYGEIRKDEKGDYEISFFPSFLSADVKNLLRDMEFDPKGTILRLHYNFTGEYLLVRDQRRVEELLSLEPMYVLDEVYEKFSQKSEEEIASEVKVTSANIKRIIDFYDSASEFLKITNEPIYEVSTQGFMRIFKDSEALGTVYWEAINLAKPQIFKLFAIFGTFVDNMVRTNTRFMPSYQGTQDGDCEAELKLHKLACEIIEKRRKNK